MGSAPLVLQTAPIGPETLPLLLMTAGLLLSVAEAVVPGANFVVLGVALLAAGAVGFLVPALAAPAVLGLLVAAFGAVALYGYRELDLYGGEAGRTTDSDSLRGTTGRVTERVTPTTGQVRLEGGGFDPHYAARSVGGEFPEGTEVIVVDPGGGNVVTVEALDAVEDDIDRQLRRDREREDTTEAGEKAVDRDRDPDRERERERETDG
ncbi:MAG: NfeD family protein [Haloferacaceae archaeon]